MDALHRWKIETSVNDSQKTANVERHYSLKRSSSELTKNASNTSAGRSFSHRLLTNFVSKTTQTCHVTQSTNRLRNSGRRSSIVRLYTNLAPYFPIFYFIAHKCLIINRLCIFEIQKIPDCHQFSTFCQYGRSFGNTEINERSWTNDVSKLYLEM